MAQKTSKKSALRWMRDRRNRAVNVELYFSNGGTVDNWPQNMFDVIAYCTADPGWPGDVDSYEFENKTAHPKDGDRWTLIITTSNKELGCFARRTVTLV